MSEAWYKEWCPECSAVNWFCNGDESDITGVDVEGYKCRKCGHIVYLGGDYKFDAEMRDWDNVEDCNWELGLERPE